MDLTTCKALLNITDSTRDAQIEALLPVILAEINAYCNQSYEAVPTALYATAAKMMEYQLHPSVKSESLGDYSVSYESNYPQSVYEMLNKFRKVVWR